MHPLASRYVQSFQQLQARLRTFSSSMGKGQGQNANSRDGSESRLVTADRPSSAAGELQNRQDMQNANMNARIEYPVAYNHNYNPYYDTGDAYRPTMGEASLMAGFEDEFANIETLLLDSTGWTGLMEDWNEG